jgi:tripartite-type tricarboxylate transporter receptor subunit TctC
VIDRISAAARQALTSDTVAKALAPQGIDIVGGTPEEFAAYIGTEMTRWETVARAAGLKK